MHILYLIGEPGVGKSTLANYLTRDLVAEQVGGPGYEPGGPGWHPVPHIKYRPQDWAFRRHLTADDSVAAIQLGCMHESGFHGTDRLRRDIMPFLLRWVVSSLPDVPPEFTDWVFADDTFRGEGYPEFERRCAMTHPAHPLILAEGDRLCHETFFNKITEAGFALELVHLVNPATAASRRINRGGKVQNPTWIKGRRSQAQRLANLFGATTIDAGLPLAVQAGMLAGSPVVKALSRS